MLSIPVILDVVGGGHEVLLRHVEILHHHLVGLTHLLFSSRILDAVLSDEPFPIIEFIGLFALFFLQDLRGTGALISFDVTMQGLILGYFSNHLEQIALVDQALVVVAASQFELHHELLLAGCFSPKRLKFVPNTHLLIDCFA